MNRSFPTRNDFLQDIVGQMVKRRQALGLTQADLDHLMGNSERLVSKWECGLRMPTSFNLYCWAEALQAQLKVEHYSSQN